MKTYSIDHLTPMQKTLLITLRGRAVDSRSKRPILNDRLAAETVDRLDYDMETVKLTAGVPEGIAIRTRMLDRAVAGFIAEHPDAVVVELGCGLETRIHRLGPPSTVDWFDIDFPEVIELRHTLLPPRPNAHPIGADLLDSDWTATIPRDRPTIVVADGVLGFLSEAGNRQVLTRITDHFEHGQLAANAYTKFAASLTGRFTQVVGMPRDFRGFGLAGPADLSELAPGLQFIEEQFGDAAPERALLNPVYRFLGWWFAHWTAQARRGVWIVRYRF